MSDDSLPPANLILQALHGIRADLKAMQGLQKVTNERLESLEGEVHSGLSRLDGRLEHLERRTTRGFLDTNTKLAALTKTVADHDKRLDHMLTKGLGAEIRELRVRVERIESGRSARAGKPPKKK